MAASHDYWLIPPYLPNDMIALNSVFLHTNVSGRSYCVVNLKEAADVMKDLVSP